MRLSGNCIFLNKSGCDRLQNGWQEREEKGVFIYFLGHNQAVKINLIELLNWKELTSYQPNSINSRISSSQPDCRDGLTVHRLFPSLRLKSDTCNYSLICMTDNT